MADFPQRDDFFRIAEEALLIDNPRLTRKAAETPGTDINGILQLATAVGTAVVGQFVKDAAGFYIDAAVKQQLDHRILDATGLARKEEASAYGSVEFSNPTPVLAQFPIPQDTELAGTDGSKWVTTESVIFPRLAVGPLVVGIRSFLTGRNQYAAPGIITSIASQIPGAPPTLKVINTKATSVGDSKQEDESYRAAYRGFFPAAARATLTAIEQRALRVPGVVTARCTEILDGEGLPSKKVLLGITDQFTLQLLDQTVIPPKYAAQSQVLAQTVANALRDTRAGGIPVLVQLAVPILQPIALDLGFNTGVDIADTAFRARVRVHNFVNALPRGEPLVYAQLRDELRKVRGVTYDSGVRFPPGDVIPRPLEALRTDLSFVSVGSTNSDRPLLQTSSPDA